MKVAKNKIKFKGIDLKKEKENLSKSWEDENRNVISLWIFSVVVYFTLYTIIQMLSVYRLHVNSCYHQKGPCVNILWGSLTYVLVNYFLKKIIEK